MKEIEISIDSFKTKHEAFITGCDSIEEIGLWNKELYGEMDAFYSNDLEGQMILILISFASFTKMNS